MRILMVGPGIMPIPSDGWGAVETVIWQQKVHLDQLGHCVDILNKRGLTAALKAKPWKYDVVHLHYDELAGFWIKLSKVLRFPLVITTHYGYAAIPDRWDEYYKQIFNELKSSKGMVTLSPEIRDVCRDLGYRGWIGVLHNGTEVSEIKFSPHGNNKAISLGKVEVRKGQAVLAKELIQSKKIECDFVGPVADDNFGPDDKYANYLGKWNREQVHTRLTEYSCLVLASDGEAHALVVCEALAAGLSLVITPAAAANLDTKKPWIHVIQKIDETTPDVIKKACAENDQYRSRIREYAEQEFDWKVVAERYAEIVSNGLKEMR